MADLWNKYEPTAARKRGTPGKQSRPKSTTVDMHAHVAIPQAGAIAGPHVDPAKVPLDHFSTPETKAIMAKQAADIGDRIRNTDARFKVMDEMGVDVQLISPGPPQLYYTIPLDIAVKATQALNDGIAEYIGKHTDRLCALGGVPLSDADEAVKELERCMKQLKFKGVEILTNVDGKELSDPAFAPFWKKAEELGALVMIHPNGFTEADRLSRFYFNNVIGNPLETTVATAHLIFDGVMDRYPKLKVLLPHAGGYLAHYWARMDHAHRARPDCHVVITKAPSTSGGYFCTSAINCPTTIRIATMPRMPPVSTTQSLGDMATATRIESIEKARFISSTRTTVAQNGDSPNPGLAGGGCDRSTWSA